MNQDHLGRYAEILLRQGVNLQSGQQVRLLLKESVDPFAKDRYSEGVITLR